MKNLMLVLLLLTLLASGLCAQQIMLDRSIEVAGLRCFSILGDSLNYLYLPARARFALNEDSLPAFSFVRYAADEYQDHHSDQTGEAILTFKGLYDTDQKQLEAAQKALRYRLGNENIAIKGPVVFDEGRFIVISSSLMADGKKSRKIFSTGVTTLFENTNIVTSFILGPSSAQLLLESLRMNTSDISLVFELLYSGLTAEYMAGLTIDWEEVRKSLAHQVDRSTYFLSTDIKPVFERLFSEKAITWTDIGPNQDIERLYNVAYSKLLKLLFKPLEPEKLALASRLEFFDKIAAVIPSDKSLVEYESLNTFPSDGYQLRDLSSAKGETKLHFQGRSITNGIHLLTFNFPDLYNQYGADERIFKDIILNDPSFRQRSVLIRLDGSFDRDFSELFTTIRVRMRKRHENGSVTLREKLINGPFPQEPEIFVYLNLGDSDIDQWLNYEYQTEWQLLGGGTYLTNWKTSNSSIINLSSPVEQRVLSLEGDIAKLIDSGVKVIMITLQYSLMGKPQQRRFIIKTTENLNKKEIEVFVSSDHKAIDYQIIWIKKDGTRLESKGQEQIGMIFIDHIPTE